MLEGRRPRGRCRHAGRRALPRPRRGADGRHLSRRPHPRRPAELQRRPRRRPAGAGPVGAAEGAEAAAGAAEDRHAAAHRRALDRLQPARRAARRPAIPVPGRSASWARPSSTRGRCRAGSPTPTSARTRSSAAASTAARCSPASSAGVGPRYCPSIEDKVNRFADKTSHQIFLEPEGLTTHEFYPNGISTSLPFDIQIAAVQSMRGLENAHILRPGYAIEYDYFDPRELKPSFETRAIARPVLRRPDQRHHGLRGGGGAGLVRRRQRGAAGAGQGALAAAPRPGLPGRAGGRPRHQGRDRALPHVHQPRRVPAAAARGQRRPAPDRDRPRAGPGRRRCAGRPSSASASGWSASCSACARPGCARPPCRPADAERLLGKALEHEYSLADLLRRPGRGLRRRQRTGRDRGASRRAVSRETLRAEYGAARGRRRHRAGRDRHQVRRLHRQAERRGRPRLGAARAWCCRKIWTTAQVTALSFEVRQTLARHRPATLGQASRISGVTPAAVSLLLVHLKKRRLGRPGARPGRLSRVPSRRARADLRRAGPDAEPKRRRRRCCGTSTCCSAGTPPTT